MLVVDVAKNITYFLLLFLCAYTDYKNGKIYNKNILIFLIIYLMIYFITYIIFAITNNSNIKYLSITFMDELLGLIAGFIVGFVFYILGIFKGGDAKILSIVGINSGFKLFYFHFSVIIITAGIFALYVLLKKRILINRLKRVILYIKNMFLTMHYEKYISETDDIIKFPFAVYVLIGEILSYFILFLRGKYGY